MIRSLALYMVLAFCVSTQAAEQNLLTNGSFEQEQAGWRPFWSRSGQGHGRVGTETVRSGDRALQVEHSGTQDWSIDQDKALAVREGQIHELTGWVQLKGDGDVDLCVVLRDQQQQVIHWMYAAQSSRATADWRQLRCRFVVPAGATHMTARLVGNGPATVLVDDVSLIRVGDIADMRPAQLPVSVSIENAFIQLTFDTHHCSLSLLDHRTDRLWGQHPLTGMSVLDAKPSDQAIDLKLLDTRTMLQLDSRIELADDQIQVSLSGNGSLDGRIAFPAPVTTEKGMALIVPVNEGISYPVDDSTLPAMHYHLYGGHGLCMAWYGIVADQEGLLTIVDTPDDASVQIPRIDGRLTLAPQWESQKGRFGVSRKLTYVLLEQGGYVAMCKRVRRLRRQQGLLRTLAEKKEVNPDVDLLVGAVNVWCWDPDPVSLCRELQQAGIDRILWSGRGDPQTLEQLNTMGILTSRYDIYQDAMNPENFPKLPGKHPDWTSDAWPDDLMVDRNGDWVRGWKVRGKDGQFYPCGVLCDAKAVDYARQRIPAELATHAYGCRFIDTTTAAPWRECFHPDHSVTRTQSRQAKMDLLRYISHDCGLVTGSETGHEAAVPFLHYFEGMMSLGPYRIPDAGRAMAKVWDEVPERVAKFQTGHFYRLPLWEMVYHDCVVSQWYWGDYNNKLPKLWDRRDLWNALYGTPPMFMFQRAQFRELSDRFVKSYRVAATVARATGYSEMLSHQWLTDDHTVQQTRFANGVVVTVNFGESVYRSSDGTVVKAMSHLMGGPVEDLAPTPRQRGDG